MSLYTDLIKQFHPDISQHPDAHRRAVLINQNKNNYEELKRLAERWGVTADKRYIFTNCLECDILRIAEMPFLFCCGNRKMHYQDFTKNGFKFPECPRGFKY